MSILDRIANSRIIKGVWNKDILGGIFSIYLLAGVGGGGVRLFRTREYSVLHIAYDNVCVIHDLAGAQLRGRHFAIRRRPGINL